MPSTFQQTITTPAERSGPPATFAGAPYVPAEARADLLVLKGDAPFLCTRPDGDIVARPRVGEGFYLNDTRHLSELVVLVGGVHPVLLSSVIESGRQAIVDQTNPWLRDNRNSGVPQETINLRRVLVLDDRLHLGLRLRSFCRDRLSTTVELILAADFADVFDVRAGEASPLGRLEPVELSHGAARFRHRAPDGVLRETQVAVDPAPADAVVEGERLRLRWEVCLASGQAAELALEVRGLGPRRRPSAAAKNGRPRGTAAAIAKAKRLQGQWRSQCTEISSGNELFDNLIAASVRDIQALMMPADGGQLPAAGVPWYVSPFGRDSLIAAREALVLNPLIARGTLRVLAALQAQTDDPFRDAEPGKILHELRNGELARLGKIPHTPYYGTVDATPLFLALAGDYYAWTLDLETIEAILPALEAALKWIDVWGDRDGDGFVEYLRRSPAGLLNQGWKDSEDSVLHTDGRPAEGPIALAEVQGYVYAAKRKIADLYDQLGWADRAGELREQAAKLKDLFNEKFWDERENYFVLALDGRKQQVRTVTSNPAHCLFCGIVAEEKAKAVAERLLADDMFSGWGVRTVSNGMATYNPMSYHNGSVWPHDNAIAVAGLKRYGFRAEAQRIAKAIFDVGVASPNFRLPELLCGFARGDYRQYVAYPVACSPQAWAAASPLLIIESLLGLQACGAQGQLRINEPELPDWLGALDLRRLKVGKATVSLSFRRTGSGHTGFALLDQEGELGVTMAAAPAPELPRSSGPSRRPSSIR